MLNRVFYGDDVLHHARSAGLKNVFLKWKALAGLKRVTFADLVQTIGNATAEQAMLVLPDGGDYYYVYQGAALTRTIGTDYSGKMLSELQTSVAPELKTVFDQVTETGIPVYLLFMSTTERDPIVWERLVLPLKISARTTMLFLYSETIDARSEGYAHLFASSPNAHMVAMPVIDHADLIADGVLVAANPAALGFFGTDLRADRHTMLRHLSPWFSDPTIWAESIAPLAKQDGERTLAVTHLGSDYRICISRLDTFLTIVIRLGAGADIVKRT